MATPLDPSPREPAIDPTGLVIGVGVGIPAAVGVGAVLALARGLFDQTNAALILMIVVVAVAALGGRTAGVITALAAVVSICRCWPVATGAWVPTNPRSLCHRIRHRARLR